MSLRSSLFPPKLYGAEVGERRRRELFQGVDKARPLPR